MHTRILLAAAALSFAGSGAGAVSFSTPDFALSQAMGMGLMAEIYSPVDAGTDTLAQARTIVNNNDPDAMFTTTTVDYPKGAAQNVVIDSDGGQTFADMLDAAEEATIDNVSVLSNSILNSVMRFTGFLRIDNANTTLNLGVSSDDGSELIIQGTTVISNDGIHATPGAGAGPEAVLFEQAGLYAIELLFFESQQRHWGLTLFEGTDPGVALDKAFLTPKAVPLPAPVLLLLAGIGGLAVISRKKSA